jgi:histidyl-tRNA synthetase
VTDNNPTYSAPRGTYDVVPPRSAAWLAVREALATPPRLSGYGYVEPPMIEHTELFVRGVGESTDIVTKEMYTFTTKGGTSLTLRPEGTAGVLRAVVQNQLYRGQLPLKVWYTGPQFRYENPQKGRYRQHTQVGVEAIGSDDPALDAEVIWLATEAHRRLGLSRVRLLLNSLGCAECRPAYRARLQEYLAGLDLDADTRRRAEINPLRVLDDKRPEMREKLAGAPLIIDSLCAACKEFHDGVRAALAGMDVSWEDDPRLVRGMDYYARTTFEFVHDGLGAQSAIGGGGRYDGLLETLGGPALGGVGFGLGLDRHLLACEAEGLDLTGTDRLGVYLVTLGEAAHRRAPGLLVALRRAGVSADMSYGSRGLKGQMKAADRSGARYAVVVGERDLDAGVVQLKDLAGGEQVAVPLDDLVTTVKEKLSR